MLKRNICFLLLAHVIPLLSQTVFQWQETAGKGFVLNVGEQRSWETAVPAPTLSQRVILSFLARIERPMHIGKQWYLKLSMNGKIVSDELSPAGSGIHRLVNRTSSTFHGTPYAYFNQNCWNVASNPQEEYIELVYTPQDYHQVYYYQLDVTDLCQQGKNVIGIQNMAPKAAFPVPMRFSKCNLKLMDTATLPQAVMRGFEVIRSKAPCSIPSDWGAVQWQAGKLPPRQGFTRLLRIQARLDAGNTWGHNSDLKVSVNGKSMPWHQKQNLPRILNRLHHQFFGRNTPSMNEYGSLRIFHHHDFVPPPPSPHHDSPERTQTFWTYLDMEDLSHEDQSWQINLINTAENKNFKGYPPHTPNLVIGHLDIGYLPNHLVNKAPTRNLPTRQADDGQRKTIADYTIVMQPSGGFHLLHRKQTYFIESLFSYPHGGINSLLCKGAPDTSKESVWIPRVSLLQDGFSCLAKGNSYCLQRTVQCLPKIIRIKDKITNLSNRILGLSITNRFIADARPLAIYRNGTTEATMIGTHRDPAPNSTVFMRMPKSGMGIVVEDDVFRLQAQYHTTSSMATVATQHLGIDQGKSYTLEWSIHLIDTNDYFDFINAVRKDWGVNNRTVLGGMGWPDYYGTPDECKHYFKNLGTRLVGLYWFNLDRAPAPGSLNPSKMLENYRLKHMTWQKLIPDGMTFLMYQGVLTWRNKRGIPDPMEDSCIITPAGKPLEFSESYRGKVPGEYHVQRYFTTENTFYKYSREVVGQAMDLGIKGIYFDTPNHINDYYGRFTYDQWDGHTVDLDPQSFTVTRKYADLCLISGPARRKLLIEILNRGGFAIYNNPPMLKEIRDIPGKLIHFTEGDREASLARMHLTTPVAMGEHYGSSNPQKPLYGRRKTWASAEDLMDDIRWKLQNGLLYYVYRAPVATPTEKLSSIVMKHEWPTAYMFPITVTDIHAGWIRGKERIIISASGNYQWPENPPKEAILRRFDRKGVPLPVIRQKPNHCGSFAITVPPQGMAILIRPEYVPVSSNIR